VYYATHASLRYRHPIDPIVLTLTAIAAAGAKRRESRIVPPVQEARETIP